MAEDTNQTPETPKVPKNRDELKASIRQRVVAARLPHGLEGHIINETNQMVDAAQGDIGQIATSANAAVDNAIAAAQASLVNSGQEAEAKVKVATGIDIDQQNVLKQQARFNEMSKQAEAIEQEWKETRRMLASLDTLTKERERWTEEMARTAALENPEQFRDHLADIKGEIAIRDNLLENDKKSMEQYDAAMLGMAKNCGLPSDSIAALRKKLQEMLPTEHTEPTKKVAEKMETRDWMEKGIRTQETKLKCRKQEEQRLEKVRKEVGLPPITMEEMHSKIDSMASAMQMPDEQIEKVKQIAEQREVELEQKEQEKIGIANEGLLELCDMVRDKLHGLSPNAAPQEVLAFIEAHPELHDDEEIDFVRQELAAEFPDRTQDKAQGQQKEETGKGTAMSPINGEDQKALEDVAKTLQKSWAQTTKPNPPDHPTKGGNSWSR